MGLDLDLGLTAGPADALVFRRTLEQPIELRPVDGAEFVLVAGPVDAWRERSAIVRCFGFRGLPKTLAKLTTRSRLLFAVVREGQFVHHGWLTLSYSDTYPVAEGDVVIGPIVTVAALRSRGLASFGLQGAMNAMLRRGHRVFYIYTSTTNLASRRVIAKCHFGQPVAVVPG